MPVKVHIPTPLREFTQGQAIVPVEADTVQAALHAVTAKFPGLQPKLFKDGQLHRYINLFLNDEDVRYLDELNTAVKHNDELSIIPAVAGG